MLSIIIPSRCDDYLQKTIDDLLLKAEGEVEVIVVFDGYWPVPMIKDNPRVRFIHHGTQFNSKGMRESINAGINLAKGDHIMKIDEHCLVDQGYDVKLAADCEDNWVVIPRRERLDAEKWDLTRDGRPPIDYMYVEYPYLRLHDKTQGLHGAEWKRPERSEILIDDTPTMQGSCYYMTRKHWDTTIKFFDTEKYGPFTMEAQEVSMPTWFSGGRVVVNKKTYYAHFHKGHKGKGYGFSNAQWRWLADGNEKGRKYAIEYWMNTKDYKYDWEWFINEKFSGMPGWGPDWVNDVIRDKKLENEQSS
jgi:glycosyltransferase involved in cell wall biosynthesis